MPSIKSLAPRGASSAVPIVVMSVFFFLAALFVWMWYDMSKSDLAGKAKTYAELKRMNRDTEQPEIEPGPAKVTDETVENVFECRRAASAIAIDGSANDPAWRDAQIIENFAQPWRGPNHPAKTKTAARLLWDDQYLYFVAEMDDADVFADVTEHNGDTWNNDVFELFFKPSETKLAYYEFEVNAQNATLDMFIPSRGSGGPRRWIKNSNFHLETKVALRGATTLNNDADRDIGWIVEGRIPWTDFAKTGGKPKAGDTWKFALCRYDYSIDNEEPELSTCAPLKQQSFHRYEDYAVLKFK